MAALEDTGIHVRWLRADGTVNQPEPEPGTVVQVERMPVALDPASFDGLPSDSWVIRPTGLHWVARTGGGTAGMLARLSSKARRGAQLGLRSLAQLECHHSHPVDVVEFEAWSQLYKAQVERMTHGRDYASMFRDETIASDSPFHLVTWRAGAALVAGILYRLDLEMDALVARFGAVATDRRDAELPRGMYLTLAQVAHDLGLEWLSLGNDANFYGTATSPGLAAFKLRLGFTPVPSVAMGNSACRTVADRVLDFSGMTPPVLRFAYTSVPTRRDAPDSFVDGPDRLELVSTAPRGFTDAVLSSLPVHRAIPV